MKKGTKSKKAKNAEEKEDEGKIEHQMTSVV